MKCRLCLHDKKLVKAHIFPDFMYRGLFDDSHKIAYMDLNSYKSRFLPDGMYQKDILCSECDNFLLGRLETYASKFLYGKNKLSEKENFLMQKGISNEGIVSVEISKLDYNQIKLFLLSILWRASITTHPFFDQVHLGKYEEEIRKMIVNNDAGPENKFECALAYFNIDKERVTKCILKPMRITKNHNTTYLFFINEIGYHFNISAINKFDVIVKGSPKANGRMSIAVLEGEIGKKYFDSFTSKKLKR